MTVPFQLQPYQWNFESVKFDSFKEIDALLSMFFHKKKKDKSIQNSAKPPMVAASTINDSLTIKCINFIAEQINTYYHKYYHPLDDTAESPVITPDHIKELPQYFLYHIINRLKSLNSNPSGHLKNFIDKISQDNNQADNITLKAK